MKIACFATSLVPSSTANSIQLMKACQALAQTGAEVCLWVPGRQAVAWPELASHYGLNTPFEVRWLPSWRSLRRYDFTWQALQQAQDWGAGVVYTWMLQAAVLGLWRKLPVIVELHDLPTGRLGPHLFGEYLRRPGKKRLLVITHSLQTALEEAYHYRFAPHEVLVAPNGADLERYLGLPDAETARRQLGLPQGVTVGYTGHFYAGRGMDVLLELARRFPQVNFLWVGGRPEDVQAWQARLPAEGVSNVHLTGFIENRRLPLYQAAADILLMPYERAIAGSSGGDSAQICSPMKMFDYMAAGRAILSSDLPVLHEVLNERNACFCPPAEVDAWAEALARLLADPVRCQRLAEQARMDIRRYSWRERAGRALQDFE